MSIVIDHVSRRFGSTAALDDVSIEARDGEFLVLLGPSGCGKSTLLRIVAGLLEPSDGRVLIGDRDVTAIPPGDRDIAMVFQSYALYPHLTVRRNLGFGLRSRGLPKAEMEAKIAGVAERLELTPLLDRRPRALSGGQRQRVALGRAMVRDPVAFLMDEPLSNLDAKLRTATRVELTELHRLLGATFVYVTHDQVEAMTMATRIVVLNAGRVEQIGTPTEIYDEPASAFVASFMGAPPMGLLPSTATTRDGRVRIEGPGVKASLWAGSIEDRPVLLGVRPEHLRAKQDLSYTDVEITAQVVAVENLGNEEIAVCAVGETRVSVRAPRPIGLVVGDRVTLGAAAANVRLFDAETGRRLHWSSEVPVAVGAGGRDARKEPVG